jgi:PAS domain S-box-containing protein
MTDHGQITARRSAPSSARLEEAINHLSLGIVIFDEKREVVFCNERYREMYGLSPEQVKPGTPTSELIRHRLDLGLKVPVAPDDYIRERVGRNIALDTTVQQFADGRIIAYTVYPVPGGGGMATHEDITEREALNARLKKQYELGKEQEEGFKGGAYKKVYTEYRTSAEQQVHQDKIPPGTNDHIRRYFDLIRPRE